MAKYSAAVSEELLDQKELARRKQAAIRTDTRSEQAAQKREARRPLKTVALILAVCVSLGGILGLRAYNIELNYEILSVQSQLTEAQSVYITMQNELDALASEQSRDAAATGMQEATLSQMRYIDLTTENKIEVMGEKTLWAKIAAFFGGLFE